MPRVPSPFTIPASRAYQSQPTCHIPHAGYGLRFVLNREEILRVNAEEIETDVEDQTEPAYEIPNGEEISNDDWETDEEDQTEPPFWNLRNRKVNRKRR